MGPIGIISSKDGGGADSAHIEMVQWDNALSSGAGKMRGRALMVAMVSAPAVSAGPCIWAITAVVPWDLTVAFEAI